MVWVPLKNGSGQVVKDIKLKAPAGAEVNKGNDKITLQKDKTFTVTHNNRLGINRYKINMSGGYHTTNSAIRKTKERPGWEVVGGFHSPEKLAKIQGSDKVDPDANKERSKRKSFWKQDNKPGTHSYQQKKRLSKKEEFKKFSEYFENE
mgnify:FL=1|jgi:hypothetical protein|tara:strand:+ start:42 stop:488 length:447 start_codon:yes stop_codon:yes gene_type:complete